MVSAPIFTRLRRAASAALLLTTAVSLAVAALLGASPGRLSAQQTRPHTPLRREPNLRKPPTQHDTLAAVMCDPSDPTCVPIGSEPYPPTVQVVMPGTVTTPTVSVTINWCDGESTLQSVTRSITLNGVDVTGQFGYTVTSVGGCYVAAKSVGTVMLKPGDNNISASINDRWNNTGYGSGVVTYNDTTVTRVIRVVADAGAQDAAPGAYVAPRFTVTNVDGWTSTIQLSASCTGALSGCSPSATSVTLGTGASTTVTVGTTVGGVGSSGTVALAAKVAGAPSTPDTAFTVLTAVNAPAAGLRIVDASAGATPSGAPVVERGVCLTVSAGDGAAYECGDLRLVYGLQTTRTLNKVRTPTLVYGSQTARPYPVINADYTLSGGSAVPPSVTAVLLVNGAERARTTFNGGEWTPGATRRLALGFDAADLGTGLYGYVFQVIRNYSSGPVTEQAAGQFIVVNRKDSELRPGWAVAGVERLYTVGGDRLWVGGDGSARVYRYVATNIWAAQPLDGPDTLKFDGAYYTRYLSNALRVVFNSAGQHVQTVNRIGATTTFSYDASGRLQAITLPTPKVSSDGNSVLVKGQDTTPASGSWTATASAAAAAPRQGSRNAVTRMDTTRARRGARIGSGALLVIQPPDGDLNPPNVYISPRSASGTGNTVSVSIDWCDYESSLVSTSRSITLNGVSIRGNFTYATTTGTGCVGSARSTGTVTLAAGNNTISASIDDAAGNTGSDAVSYSYSPPPPPPPTARTLTYRFGYTGSYLDSVYVTNSSNGTTLPAIRFQQVGSELRVLEPTGDTVRFVYDASVTSRINQRIDRRKIPLTFSYGAAQKLSQTMLDMSSSGAQNVVSTFTPQETRALSYTADPVGVTTVVDGPRSDVTDVSTFWLDGYGQPRRIRDPLGTETVAYRTNPTYPLLATRTVAATGQEITATYDARGNIQTSTNVANGATTRYFWNAKWDMVDSMIAPTGIKTSFGYDATTGNRLYQQIGTDPARRVNFGYNATGLLVSIRGAMATTSSQVRYDVPLGNADTVITARGMRSANSKDMFGRVVYTRTPIDTLQTLFAESRTWLDAMGRDTLHLNWGPSISYDFDWSMGPAYGMTAKAESIFVSTKYDREGNTLSVSRRAAPDLNGLGSVVTQFRYDAAGRKVADIAPDGRVDSTVYDPAGNAIASISRRGHRISRTYDAAGRMVERRIPSTSYPEWTPGGAIPWSFPRATNGYLIPADVERFGYDKAGHIVVADNSDSRITRGYNRDGTVAFDTLRLRNWSSSVFGHAYGIRYDYDIGGRRTGLHHPTNLAPLVSGVVKELQSYSYDPAIGALSSTTDVLGNTFRFTYDLEGRLDSLIFPGGVFEKRYYDDDGELVRRTETATLNVGQPGGFSSATVHNDQIFYDARGKVIEARTPSSIARNGYSALGTLVDALNKPIAPKIEGMEELSQADAFGNPKQTWAPTMHNGSYSDSIATSRFTWYHGATSRIDSTGSFSHGGTVESWDESGNKIREPGHHGTAPNGVTESWSVFYYDAAQRLRAMDKRSCIWDAANGRCNFSSDVANGDRGYFQEYRYDAFGRRVVLRSLNDSSCIQSSNQCVSTIERTVYDGNEILYEIRMPGGDNVPAADLERDSMPAPTGTLAYYGRIAYASGLTIDRPLSIIRMGYNTTWPNPIAIFPHVNWRGLFDTGSFPDGRAGQCTDYTNPATCITVDFPTPRVGVFFFDPFRDTFMSFSWMGSLIPGRRDATGQMYMRNRYYDPTTGQFTQEDPIGLAGGLNAYGFANGDPVNFSDPFGLAGCDWGNVKDCIFATVVVTLNTWGMGTSLGPLGKVEGDISPVGKLEVSSDIGPGGVTKPEVVFKEGYELKASVKAGPVKVTVKGEAAWDTKTNKVSGKVSGSASARGVNVTADGFGVKAPGASVTVKPHYKDIFIFATEPIYEWAKPGLDFITGHSGGY